MRNISQEISNIINSSRVVLFMKGTPESPYCGFSARATSILNAFGWPPGTYNYVNVLEDSEIREAIKDFSNWPTIPQLYIDGEFIGGSDIMQEMFVSGELKTLLKLPETT